MADPTAPIQHLVLGVDDGDYSWEALDLARAVADSVGDCGNNACHNDGAGGNPNVATYDWGTAQTDCETCHAEPNDNARSTARVALASTS